MFAVTLEIYESEQHKTLGYGWEDTFYFRSEEEAKEFFQEHTESIPLCYGTIKKELSLEEAPF